MHRDFVLNYTQQRAIPKEVMANALEEGHLLLNDEYDDMDDV